MNKEILKDLDITMEELIKFNNNLAFSNFTSTSINVIDFLSNIEIRESFYFNGKYYKILYLYCNNYISSNDIVELLIDCNYGVIDINYKDKLNIDKMQQFILDLKDFLKNDVEYQIKEEIISRHLQYLKDERDQRIKEEEEEEDKIKKNKIKEELKKDIIKELEKELLILELKNNDEDIINLIKKINKIKIKENKNLYMIKEVTKKQISGIGGPPILKKETNLYKKILTIEDVEEFDN